MCMRPVTNHSILGHMTVALLVPPGGYQIGQSQHQVKSAPGQSVFKQVRCTMMYSSSKICADEAAPYPLPICAEKGVLYPLPMVTWQMVMSHHPFLAFIIVFSTSALDMHNQ